MENSLRQGQLIKWSGDRGFGFIQPAKSSQSEFLSTSGKSNMHYLSVLGYLACRYLA